MFDAELPPDGNDVGKEGDGITQGRLRRASSLAGLTARTAGESIAVGLRTKLTGTEDPEFHARAVERYVELLGRSKGALMKAGQMLSFVAGTPVLTEDFQPLFGTALARLCSDAPAMPAGLTRVALERELGRPVEQVFSQFDWDPLAAASIGQVHAARLPDGREVAVKVQYPGVADAIRADLKNVELLATLLSLVGSMSSRRLGVDLRGMAAELSLRITEELDYRLEAAHQAEFAGHFRGHPFIHVPEVVAELCTGRVLTQELVHARRWEEALTAPQELRDQWGEAIFRFVYGSYVNFQLINADPHPGNYLFHDDGRVSFLDYGCTKRFPLEQAKACIATVRACCLQNDVLETWQGGLEAGFWHSSDPVTPEELFVFWRSLWELVWAEQPFTVTPERAARGIEHFSPTGPSAKAVQGISASPDYTVMARIEIGTLSVLAQLRASCNWRAVMAEALEGAAPATAMGKRSRAYYERRLAAGGQ
jgi:predicted unusual protein kinase regulating ubiquinone biosynthesis (AarF/ABC1/UbiB family)